jgi:hypothetical protein
MSNHKCHAFNCPKETPPSLFMCKRHWFTLPANLRNAILANYRRGQELDKQPTVAYMCAAYRARIWLAKKEFPLMLTDIEIMESTLVRLEECSGEGIIDLSRIANAE